MIWRVRDRATFVALSRAPRVRRGPIMVRRVPSDDGTTRVAYAIGRTVGSAVVRNRIRRRVRAVVAARGDDLAPGAYLIGARREVLTMPFAELDRVVDDALTAAAAR
ncbi:MAG: ribonuclease P protein component [Acidimicrobiia bacterium]